MKVKCHFCGEIFEAKQYHAGFSGRGFLYCSSCPTILEFDTYNPRYVSLVGDKHPWSLDQEEKNVIEQALKPCPKDHSGRFKFDANPRCPKCNCELPDLLADNIHFVVLGDVVDGDIEDVWQESQ